MILPPLKVVSRAGAIAEVIPGVLGGAGVPGGPGVPGGAGVPGVLGVSCRHLILVSHNNPPNMLQGYTWISETLQ